MTSILTRGNEVRVNTYTSGDQSSPKVATLSDGRYVVTWDSFGQDGSAYGVYMQMYDSSGARIGTDTSVNTTTINYQINPAIVALEGGGFVIAWQSYSQDGAGYGIYFQRYDDTGAAVEAETLINSTTASDQIEVSLSALQWGGFVATWSSYSQDASGTYGVYAKVYNESGFPLTGEIAVNTTTANTQSDSQVATLSDGSFVVTWESNGQDGSTYGVYMRRFNVFGTALTSETLVNTTVYDVQYRSDVIALANGGYVVSWEGVGEQTDNFDTWGTFYQIYDAYNNKVGSETLINTYTSLTQHDPSMAALSDGGFVIVWYSAAQDGGGYGVFGQRYDENGAEIGPEFQVNGFTYSNQLNPSVSALNDGGFVVTWQSLGQDGSGYGIYSRRYGAATTLSGTQYLYGTIDGDRLDGGIGGDYMYGGQGDDTYVVNASSDVIGENADQGIDLVETSISIDLLGTNVEHATLLGIGDLNATGNASRNYLLGNSGRNTLSGAEGEDTIYGGDGNDSILGGADNDYLDGGANNDYVSGDDGNDTLSGGAGIDFVFGGNGYDVLYGGDGNDRLYGDALEDVLYGEVGNDELNGGLGNDSVYGGDGEDYIFGEEGNDLIDGGAGNDTLIGGAGGDAIQGGEGNDYINGYGENDVIYGGIGQDTIMDGLGDDTVYAGDHDDIVYVGGGIDHLNGEGGIDTLNASELSVGVYANLATGLFRNNAEISFLSGFENLTGTAFNDKLYGDAGNNVIDGGGGADTMAGGAGNDVYYVDNIADRVSETSGQGDDVVFSSTNINIATSVIETVYLTGSENINFYGNEFATEVWGNSGNNLLSSGLGADTMYGGLGNDTYIIDDAGDIVSENASEGTDVTKASVTYSLTANVEILTLTGTANINGTGNSLNNTIQGNSGNNRLDAGAGGTDILSGFLGDDTYVFNLGFGVDTITSETGGADTILFGAGITSAMIIMQDVGADRYYAIDDGVHQASTCANRIRIIGGAGGAVIETIAYTPPAAPPAAPVASAALLTQAIAALPVSGASINTGLARKMTAPITSLAATSLIHDQRLVA